MKRLLVLLLCLICIFGYARGDSSATPTDLTQYEIFEDDDYGYIESFNRQVFLNFLKEPSYLGEEVTLVAVLVNFKSTDIYSIDWQYSTDKEIWYIIQDAHEQTYTFVLDKDNHAYWWRVIVTIDEN